MARSSLFSVAPRSRMWCAALLAVGTCVLPGPRLSLATPRDPGRLQLKTERVIVFKDGHCLVLRRGTGVTNPEGEVFTGEVPDAAVLGSFWAIPKAGRLLNMVAGWEETTTVEEKQVPCLQTIEILKANVGQKCSLQLPDNSVVQGVIQEVLTHETTSPLDDALRATLGLARDSLLSSRMPPPSAMPAAAPPSRSVRGITGSHFVLRTDQGDVLLSAAEVRRVTVTRMKTSLARKVETTKREKRLTFRFAEPGQARELSIAYFRPGIRWIPTYRINLGETDSKQKVADMSMQAEILNEAEDLIETPLDIVVGVPNFRFRTTPSPLILEQTLRNALAQAAPQLMGQLAGNTLSNAMFTQRSSEWRREQPPAEAPAEAAALELPAELTAAAAQELFVYHLNPITLRRGERAAVPIFTTTVPYRDIYTWEVHPKRSDIATAPSGSGVRSPLTLSENQVWRQIELVNSTGVPWTTGAALVTQGHQPLAQELLTYTSPKDACRVPVTVAVDLRGSFSEQETDRQLQALTWDAARYAKVSQRASLVLRNHKRETVNVEITLRLGGRAERATHEGRVTISPFCAEDWQQYRGSPAVNNRSTVVWNVALRPGEAFQPSVDYHFYARH